MTLPHKPNLIIRQKEPLNGGPSPEVLGSARITPNRDFFVRNHAPIPDINPQTYQLRIGGKVKSSMTLSLSDIKTKFSLHQITAVLQCAGYRRRELEAIGPIPNEIIWDTEAIGTAVWAGARMADVLNYAELDMTTKHIAFVGLDLESRKDGAIAYGGSIPIEKALHPDTLLAYEMNGEPLPAEHGFPLRVIVPGYIGARSVKWLGQIIAQDEPSDNYYQQRAYRQFSPLVTPHDADWDSAPMLGDLRLNVVVVEPKDNAILASDFVIRGFAWTGEGHTVAEVLMSADGGATWQAAEFIGEDAGPWSWREWRLMSSLAPGNYTLIIRATDTSGQIMPLSVRETWNFKGYMNNACPRIRVQVRS